MAVELTIAGASGLKALAAAKAAAAAAKQAAANAVAMAQNTNLASSEAMQAQANLEKYVFGSPVSTVPPVVTPMPPATIAKYPSYPYLNYPLSWTDKVAPLPMMPPHLISEHPWMHGGYLDRQVAHASMVPFIGDSTASVYSTLTVSGTALARSITRWLSPGKVGDIPTGSAGSVQCPCTRQTGQHQPSCRLNHVNHFL
ncbi:hypothetical protein FOZ61_007730 [Perkinsus olseni]|uniref:Uncharacterized protein n=1 Tax=Perkinsus olseni TaxID=32597 RepID=A0A7J6LKF2_PEROL|nr:hypothetical protein FOZ61_007730 [Perkinsus olseni]KAF4659767.1 hypothetical protein FOL46_006450 [Perkinsus olseni]